MKDTNTQFRLGRLNITRNTDLARIPDRATVGRARSSGIASVFKVSGAGVNLELHYVRWRNTEREVRCEAASSGPPAVLHLGSGRRRLQVCPVKSGPHAAARRQYVVLRQAQIVDSLNGWSHLYSASAHDLDRGAGLLVKDELERAGAVDVDTREAAFDERGRCRSQLCAVFERDDEMVPVVAFVLTRVLPLLNSVGA